MFMCGNAWFACLGKGVAVFLGDFLKSLSFSVLPKEEFGMIGVVLCTTVL